MDRRGFLTLPLAGIGGRLLAQQDEAFRPDVEIDLTAAPAEHRILPGNLTKTFSYTARLVRGRPGTIGDPIGFLGPPLRFRRGDKVRIRLFNKLPEATIVHWHGLNVPEKADGHPRLAIAPGGEYLYEFEVIDRAGLYWYHPHPHEHTASQAYWGLAGPVIVTDGEEAAAGLPSGEREIPLVIQDRNFDARQQLEYVTNRMELMHGFLGDRILVNGAPDRELTLGTAAYRLRFMNGSNSRIYKLAWSNGKPMTVIGSDGGLLAAPREKPWLTLAPGQRADTILDLSGSSVGERLELRSLPFPAPMTMGGMGRMGGIGGPDGGSGLGNGAPFSVLRVHVARKEAGGFKLPARLSEPAFKATRAAVNPGAPRQFSLSFMRMQWYLNGARFEMDSVRQNEIFDAGGTYLLELSNSPQGMMQMAHPMHFHGGQFQVVQRISASGTGPMKDALADGFLDEGWLDTVLVLPGERVRILMTFPRYKGLYLYHCHTLEHEDSGMMRNFRTV